MFTRISLEFGQERGSTLYPEHVPFITWVQVLLFQSSEELEEVWQGGADSAPGFSQLELCFPVSLPQPQGCASA